MKLLFTAIVLLFCLSTGFAQSDQSGRQGPLLHFVMSDSTIVSGHIVRQDSSMVVVRKRNGDLSYLEAYQIVRRTESMPHRATTAGGSVTAYSLKDGATIYGREIRRMPVAVVVRQRNGTQTYIDPADILNTSVIAEEEAEQPDSNVPVGAPYLLNTRTAYTPRGGQVYYRNTYLIRNEIEAGLTNGWSVGVVFNPLFIDLYEKFSYLSEAVYSNADYGTQLYTRVGVPLRKKVRLGAVLAAQLQHPSYSTSTQSVYLWQLLASFGDQRSNITIGYSHRFEAVSAFLYSAGSITVGARQQLSPSLALVIDNTINITSGYPAHIARLAATLRIQRNQHAFDIGLLSTLNQLTYIYDRPVQLKAYPYIGYNLQFGKK